MASCDESDLFWLRFLELDTIDFDAMDVFNRNSSSKSSTKKQLGRTMFTITKRLMKNEEIDSKFGFEDGINWSSKPCMIERIEKGSCAEQSKLESGDFIIFVEKVNVVELEKAEILDLISASDTIIMEIFRRSSSANRHKNTNVNSTPYLPINDKFTNEIEISKQPSTESAPKETPNKTSLISSTYSNETAAKKKPKPLVTFSKESLPSTNDNQRKTLISLLQCERQFVDAMNFGQTRYILPLKQRKDLITTNEHDVLFKNIEILKSVTEKLVENYTDDDDWERVIDGYKYQIKNIQEIYKKYFNMLKHANCILVDKTHHPEFIKFIGEPSISRNQLHLTSFINKPLQHYRDIMKIFQLMIAHCPIDSKEHDDVDVIIKELQIAYKPTTNGINEHKTDVKPLLKDLESRIVFTKCKPFKLAVPGRQWIFGGNLVRVEGNSVERPQYTLLFTDLLLFAKITRDRVLFITEEPVALNSIIESYFNVRKKSTEFRLTIEPDRNPLLDDHSPTTHCTPDLIRRSPLRFLKRKTICLRAPTEEIKNVWQNLLSRQIFNVNSFSPTTPDNHLESPDIFTATTMESMRLSCIDNISHAHPKTLDLNENFNLRRNNNILTNQFKLNFRSISTINNSITELPEIECSESSTKQHTTENTYDKTDVPTNSISSQQYQNPQQQQPLFKPSSFRTASNNTTNLYSLRQKAFDMGDSYSIDEINEEIEHSLMKTPETPSCANLSSLDGEFKNSPSSLTFSSITPSIVISPARTGCSWEDILEDFDDFDAADDVKECLFLQDKPFLIDE